MTALDEFAQSVWWWMRTRNATVDDAVKALRTVYAGTFKAATQDERFIRHCQEQDATDGIYWTLALNHSKQDT